MNDRERMKTAGLGKVGAVLNNRRTPALVAVGLALALAGTLSPPRASKAEPDSSGELAPPDLFTGFLVAANATEIYGPETSFKIRSWNATWGMVKLLELAPDGEEVKAGQVIARFEFIGRDALRWVNERIRESEADAAQSKIRTAQVFEGLLLERRRRDLEARLAAIDMERERAISKRQAALFAIKRKIAEFEVEAVMARTEAAQKALAAENTYQDLVVRRSREDLGRYGFYEKRFLVTAPHDGVMRHAFNANERRKIQKGDSVSAGMRIAYLAKDQSLAVKFFVPEHRIAEITTGSQVIVTTPASAEEHSATVTSIEFFPQELSFLMENKNLPNGMEKAFTVKAELGKSPAGLSAGAEVRVKAVPR